MLVAIAAMVRIPSNLPTQLMVPVPPLHLCRHPVETLLVLAVSQVANPAYGMLYVLLFGIGSMLGMGALSVVIAVPLAASARWLTWANRGLQGCVGVVTVGIGVTTVYSTAFNINYCTKFL
ncbi:MAG TPA: hypothetical protein VIL63_09370 [Terriglobales bacterium]